MSDARDLVRAVALEWMGHNLLEGEVEGLAAAYQAVSHSLSSFPAEILQEVEPAFRSLPAPGVEEKGR